MVAQSNTKHSIYSTDIVFEYKTSSESEVKKIAFNEVKKLRLKINMRMKLLVMKS
jgi:hypothetical protein